MKGIEIAKKLNISTSALRHYEAWGLVPKVERAKNGYRVYTKIHEAYFQCICAINVSFGMDVVRQIMPLIIKGEKLEALWLINKKQYDLYKEKEIAKRTVEMLDLNDLSKIKKHRNKEGLYTIGEVAHQTNVSASAIRHWEKEGLISPKRHKESSFRLYSLSEIRKIHIIRILQKTVYWLNIVREVLAELDNNNLKQEQKAALLSLQYFDDKLVAQVKAIACVHHLFELLSNGPNLN